MNKIDPKNTILIAAGGTGGHIFPSLSIINEIKVGNLDSLRTYSDVRDAVRAYHMMLTVEPEIGAYYNIGGSHVCKISDVLNTLLDKSTKKNISIQIDPERIRPIDADLQVPDTKKFSQHVGWKPKYSFDQTMNDLLEYWRNRIKSGEIFLSR